MLSGGTGGHFNFEGGTGADDGSFVFDFTDLAPAPVTPTRWHQHLTNASTTALATLTSLSITDVAAAKTIPALDLPLSAEYSLPGYPASFDSFVDYPATHAEVGITKSVSPATVLPGGMVTYTLAYTNYGTTATNVTLSDCLPAALAYMESSSSGGGIYTDAARSLTWSLGTVLPQASGQVTFQTTVNAGTPLGTSISNTAVVNCTEMAAPSRSNTTVLTIPAPAFTLTNTVTPFGVAAGDTVAYTLNYSIMGANTAPNVTMTDVLPPQLHYVAGSASHGGSYNAATDTLTWSLGTVTPGSNAQTVSFQATVDNSAPAGAEISDTAAITCANDSLPIVSDTALLSIGMPGPGSWWMFHHDQQHTGRSPYTGPSSALEKWAFATGNCIDSSPAVGADGTLYVGSQDGNLYAVNPDGTQHWAYTVNQIGMSVPAIGADGTIYIASGDSNLYAIDHAGTEQWAFYTGGWMNASPTIATDGTIYVDSNDGNLFAFTPNGTQLWTLATGTWINSSPALGTDGTIYFGGGDGNIYAVNPNGTIQWKFLTNACIQSSPAIGADGTIYIGSCDGNLYALTPSGVPLWKFPSGASWSSPAIGADGTIYVGSSDDHLYAISPNGKQRWAFATGNQIQSSPAIGADGTIYIGSEDHQLYAISVDGKKCWTFTTGDLIDSSPAIGADGTVYVGSNDHNLYAISQASQPSFTLSTSVNVTGAVPGSTVTYTLAYANTGAAATNVTISDTLPAGISYVTGSAGNNADL